MRDWPVFEAGRFFCLDMYCALLKKWNYGLSGITMRLKVNFFGRSKYHWKKSELMQADH